MIFHSYVKLPEGMGIPNQPVFHGMIAGFLMKKLGSTQPVNEHEDPGMASRILPWQSYSQWPMGVSENVGHGNTSFQWFILVYHQLPR